MTKEEFIKDELIERYIENNPNGFKLPSEAFLAAEFECNRHTVRGALNYIKHSGLVSSRKGQGWYVKKNSQSRAIHNIHRHNMRTNDRDYYYDLILHKDVEAGVYALFFECSKERKLGHYRRVKMDKKYKTPISYHETYYNKHVFKDLRDEDISYSISSYLQINELHLQNTISKIFTCPCPRHIAHILNLQSDEYVLGVLDMTSLSNGEPAIYTLAFHVNSEIEINYENFDE